MLYVIYKLFEEVNKMKLHTLSTLGDVKFSTTDYNDFLDKCEMLYNEVATEDWSSYEENEELINIFENHGYFYNVINANQVLKINNNNDIVNLYFKLQQYNPTFNFDNGTSLMLASNYLLNYYNDASQKYINDTDNEVSLLEEIAGDNGFDQLNFHKSFRDTYGVSIY